MQTYLGAILREYAAITLQEFGLRDAARSLRAGAIVSQRRQSPFPVSMTSSLPTPAAAVDMEMAVASISPFMIETTAELQLQFAKNVLQSRMRLDDPYALVAAYTRQMMAFLLFNPEPRHIVMIGLGGGSQPKFCHRHLPHARITVVEIDARIIAMRKSFCVPEDDERFRVVHDDGVHFMSHLQDSLDVILIDAFDELGVAPSLATTEFYANVWQRLTDDGVLVMNLLGSPQSCAMHIERVRELSGGNGLLATVAGNDNVLLFAFKPAVISVNAPQLSLRARYLQSRFRLHFHSYLQKLREGSSL